MAPHFVLLKNHLPVIVNALVSTFNDKSWEIRLHAAKCFDTIGHSMGVYLLEEGQYHREDVNFCLQFWLDMIPIVIDKINDTEQQTSMKAVCCDSLSNIGVVLYERLPVCLFII